MPGQPTPPVIVEAFALNAPVCTPAAPVVGGKTSPFPAASQIGVVNGAASLNDGFPPLTMTPIPPVGTGTPPFGVDANGILYLLSAHICAIAAGQLYPWSAVLQAAMGGYAKGAIVAQAADALAYWVNLTAGNATNPDTAAPLGSTGWISSKPLQVAVSYAGGSTQNDIVLAGGSDYIFDVTTTGAGTVTLTGFIPLRDGQKVTIRKVDALANPVALTSLGGSAVGHQLQTPAGFAIATQYDSVTIMFNSTVNAWVQL